MEISQDWQRESLRQVSAYLDAGEWNQAGELCNKALTAQPDDPETLYWMARVLVDTDKPALALPIAKLLTQMAPQRWQSWMMLGAVEAYLQRFDKSKAALLQANRMNPNNAEVLRLLGNSMVMSYDFAGMRYAHESLALEDHHQAHAVLAFGYLHQRQWNKGWKHYREQLGYVPHRDRQNFGLPEWQGEDGKVLVYAEQGLGDQIAYLSAIRPHQLTCHPKLENLFKRTFREAYGDQFATSIKWTVTSDYQTSMASVMQYVEMKPKGRYLKSHPEKREMFRKRLESLGPRKKIGIAWTGGKVGSHGWQDRCLTLNQLKPILQLDADFISIEYNKTPTPSSIHVWDDATLTPDYDDTAALVDCLDAVVSVPTTVYHLAGALGIPAHVIVHSRPHFHEGLTGNSPWWKSVKQYHRMKLGTDGAVKAIADALREAL